jgi:microcystin-dependent protein
MMDPLGLTITNAGLVAFTNAQLAGNVKLAIASVGLTGTQFNVAPTLTGLPGEFKRVATISGAAVGADTIHLMIRDADPQSYTVRGFGLFLADGTLFAVYGQAEVLVEKAVASTALIALDVKFPTNQVAAITFGSTNFIDPPATEDVAGVAEIATQAEADAGQDDTRIVTSKKLKARLAAVIQQTLPLGTIMLFFGGEAPAGWAICNGQTVNRADGTGTIKTPDMRGRVAVGVSTDHELGSTFGEAIRNVPTSEAGAHTHAATAVVDAAATGVTISTASRNVDAGSSASGVLSSASLTDPSHVHTAEVTVTNVGDHKHAISVDVTQPSLALHYIMRL